MARRRGLGRGLDALIPGGSDRSSGEVTELGVDQIERNPRQPRRNFDPADLEQLTDSIRQHGVLQPLIVARMEGDGDYVLIAGERRLQAARLAGLATVPAVVRTATDQQLLVLALIENLQRADLNPLEAAEGYRQLADEFGLSHEAIADQVGKSRSTVTNALRLLQLPESVQAAVMDGRLSEGHARALLALPTAEAIEAAMGTVLNRELNVRQTEELVRSLSGKRSRKRRTTRASPEEKALEAELRDALGTKVSLRSSAKGGTLTIHYYSPEELEALVDRLRRES
ncbi:MAG TPA: ParB/RepB/Spo0J family partition protein [Anaerolineales bacterium]|jgi:ParB family chromosome partitioning protein